MTKLEKELLEKVYKNADRMVRVLYLLEHCLSASGKNLIDKHWVLDKEIFNVRKLEKLK